MIFSSLLVVAEGLSVCRGSTGKKAATKVAEFLEKKGSRHWKKKVAGYRGRRNVCIKIFGSKTEVRQDRRRH